jgi:double-stranded uracil-DNA glycosylase
MPNHAVMQRWMGHEIRTLEDLLRPGLHAVCVGINPSPVSVEVGHYYQGRLGQRFFGRLRRVGLLAAEVDGFEDDALYAAGVGFTDIVKRPTRRGHEPDVAEFAHGREVLERELDRCAPRLVIFTFKRTAERLFGRFDGAGFQPWGPAGRDYFVMPGPMAPSAIVDEQLDALARYVRERNWDAA